MKKGDSSQGLEGHMFRLNKKSQESVYEATGLTVDQIADMDFDEIDASIAKRVGHVITDYILDDSLASRGQVYSETKRFLRMDEVDKGLEKHDRRKSSFIKTRFHDSWKGLERRSSCRCKTESDKYYERVGWTSN